MIVYLQLAFTAAIWGGAFIVGKVLVQSIGPYSAAFCRFAVASVCLVLLTQKTEGRLPKLKPQEVLQVTILGLTGIFAYNVFFFLGLKIIPASRAALIVASNPIFIALTSAVLFREKLTFIKLAGILASLIGATFVISKGNILHASAGNFGWGEMYLIGCIITWVAYTLIGKQSMKTLSPLAANTYACLVGTFLLFFPAIKAGFMQDLAKFTISTWLGIIYLGFLGSAVAFNWYYQGIKTIGASKASVFINLVPVAAIFLATVFLHEPVTPSLILGGTLVITGVFITTKS